MRKLAIRQSQSKSSARLAGLMIDDDDAVLPVSCSLPESGRLCVMGQSCQAGEQAKLLNPGPWDCSFLGAPMCDADEGQPKLM